VFAGTDIVRLPEPGIAVAVVFKKVLVPVPPLIVYVVGLPVVVNGTVAVFTTDEKQIDWFVAVIVGKAFTVILIVSTILTQLPSVTVRFAK
jgi:hypothetical protein